MSQFAHFFSGCGLEIGRGDCDRCGLKDHPNCLSIELYDHNPYWVTQPSLVGITAETLPYQNNTFDFVASSHVIEHLPDPYSALREWMRVTKTGGRILVVVPDKDLAQYPAGVYLDRDRPRSQLHQVVRAIGNRLSEGRPNCEYLKNSQGINELDDWASKNTAFHRWAWKLPDLVTLMDFVGLEVAYAASPMPDSWSMTIVGIVT